MCDSSRSLDREQSDSYERETRVIDGVIIPYEYEPLANCGEEVVEVLNVITVLNVIKS